MDQGKLLSPCLLVIMYESSVYPEPPRKTAHRERSGTPVGHVKNESNGPQTSKKKVTGVPIVAQQVKNWISIHKDASSIPGLTQWVKDPVLP